MKEYSPGGYSWLCVAPEPTKELAGKLTRKQARQLESDCTAMENIVFVLEHKIHRYHSLCRKYGQTAGTKKGEAVAAQVELLKEEIDALSKGLSQTVEDSVAFIKPGSLVHPKS